jgi:hypothetical protein
MKRSVTLGACALLLSTTAFAQQAGPARPADNYDLLLEQHRLAARAAGSSAPAGLWMAGLASDRRARRANDLITIRVV